MRVVDSFRRNTSLALWAYGRWRMYVKKCRKERKEGKRTARDQVLVDLNLDNDTKAGKPSLYNIKPHIERRIVNLSK